MAVDGNERRASIWKVNEWKENKVFFFNLNTASVLSIIYYLQNVSLSPLSLSQTHCLCNLLLSIGENQHKT